MDRIAPTQAAVCALVLMAALPIASALRRVGPHAIYSSSQRPREAIARAQIEHCCRSEVSYKDRLFRASGDMLKLCAGNLIIETGSALKAAIFDKASCAPNFLRIEEVSIPDVRPGYLLLRVIACGVCRTDLHIVERDLPPLRPRLIPGHQIVGEVAGGATSHFPIGARIGVSWMGGIDGECWYCKHDLENLCDHPTYTGYTVDGGFAEFALVKEDFAILLPYGLDATHAAPLLCAGVIGFRSLRVAGVEAGDRVGLFGFGSSATLMIPILQSWKCEVYVITRGANHRDTARSLGATWVGSEDARPDVQFDRAITFAPAGNVIVDALSCLRKGGIVAINAIHLDEMPQFNYDKLLWGERQIRSVTNMTRRDARDFLNLAAQLNIKPRTSLFTLDHANEALSSVKHETEDGSAVIVI